MRVIGFVAFLCCQKRVFFYSVLFVVMRKRGELSLSSLLWLLFKGRLFIIFIIFIYLFIFWFFGFLVSIITKLRQFDYVCFV